MINFSCPECQSENAYFTIMDENGAHYECPDCEFEWIDTSFQFEEENDNDDEI